MVTEITGGQTMKKSIAYSGLLLLVLAATGIVWNAAYVSSQSNEAAGPQQSVRLCVIGSYTNENCRTHWDNYDKSALCPAGEEPKLDSCATLSSAPRCQNAAGQNGQECECKYTCKKKRLVSSLPDPSTPVAH